jgi:nitric oxide synthase-interacting protein
VPVKFSFLHAPSSSGSGHTGEEGASEPAPAAKEDDLTAICPSCKKQLSNHMLMFRASLSLSNRNTLTFPVMKPCAHVTCKTCTDTLVRPAKQCVVCDVQLDKDAIIELRREGAVLILDFATSCTHRMR